MRASQECVASTPFRFTIITAGISQTSQRPLWLEYSHLCSLCPCLLLTCSVLPFCQRWHCSVRVNWADSGTLAMIPCFLPSNSHIPVFTLYSLHCFLFVCCHAVIFCHLCYLPFNTYFCLCIPHLCVQSDFSSSHPPPPFPHSSCLLSYLDQTSHCTWWKAHFFSGCIAVHSYW